MLRTTLASSGFGINLSVDESDIIISFGLRLLAEDATWRLITVFQVRYYGRPRLFTHVLFIDVGNSDSLLLRLMRLCNWGIAAPEALQGGFEPVSRLCWELGSTQGLAMGLLPAQREQLPRGLLRLRQVRYRFMRLSFRVVCVNLETHKGITTV